MDLNETDLSKTAEDGLVYGNLQENSFWKTLPLYDHDPGLSLLSFENGSQALILNKSRVYIGPLAIFSMLQQPNTTLLNIKCVHPLSGQYDRLPRFLFYICIISAILFRKSTVIASAALGTSMIYSSVAAIHLFILAFLFRWEKGPKSDESKASEPSRHFDIDLLGIVPIVSTAGIMLAPILLWSSTFRTHRARPVVILWAILNVIALVVALVLLNKPALLRSVSSLAYCTEQLTPGCQPKSLVDDILSYKLWGKCKCIDFCNAHSLEAPLRRGTSMVPLVGHKIGIKATDGQEFSKLVDVISYISVIAVSHSVIALLFGRWTQAELRNWVFRVGYSTRHELTISIFRGDRRRKQLRRWHVNTDKSNTSFLLVTRRWIALFIATALYLIAIAGFLIYPVTFVATAVLYELLVAAFPTSEHIDAIGSWGPWIGAGLVLTSALIMKNYNRLEKLFWGILLYPLNLLRYEQDERPKLRDAVKQKELSTAQAPSKGIVQFIWAAMDSKGQACVDMCSEFKEWFKDPVKHSSPRNPEQRRDNLTLELIESGETDIEL